MRMSVVRRLVMLFSRPRFFAALSSTAETGVRRPVGTKNRQSRQLTQCGEADCYSKRKVYWEITVNETFHYSGLRESKNQQR